MPESSKRTDNERGREAQSPTGERATAPSVEEEDSAAVAAVAPSEEALDERLRVALEAASEKKAHDLAVLDLRAVASFTDHFLIASATNARQVQAIADEIEKQLRKQQGVRPARVEGYNSAEWVLLDYGDFIFHVFEEKARRFYDLERLWRDAARVPLPPELSGGGGAREGGSLRTEQ
jgi:ribosome-associated protein